MKFSEFLSRKQNANILNTYIHLDFSIMYARL